MPGNSFNEEFENIASIDNSGNLVLPTGMGILVTSTLPIGYFTGAGDTVTQGGSKTTTVILSKPCGVITMHGAQLNAATEAKFTVTNTLVAATDVVIVNMASGGTSGSYMVSVAAVGSGSFDIVVGNISGGNLTETPVLNFAVIKGISA